MELNNKTSEQNITRDKEIKNKLTVTRGEKEKDNRAKKGKVRQGTCIKDPWTKTTEVGGLETECGRWGWVGQGRVMGGKWGQL